MTRREKYPIGQQSFEVLRDKGYVYVDKTRFIEEILEGSQYYFLARPRRFGKSLFLSTMKVNGIFLKVYISILLIGNGNRIRFYTLT